MKLARSNKFHDAADLERWANNFHFGILVEWECSEVVEWADFWDWLEQEHPEVLDEFVDYWRRGDAGGIS